MSTRRRPLPPLATLTLAVAAATGACGTETAPLRAAAAPILAPAPRPPPTPPAWTYWDSIDAGVLVPSSASPPPFDEADLAFEGDARARWSALSGDARQAVLDRGFVVVPSAKPQARVGEAYAALRDARVPYVITLDALFWLAHVARDRALASVEERVLAPALEALLRRLEVRLGNESRTAPGDLIAGYAVARGVVAVARALLRPGYVPPPDLARAVTEETKRIDAHAGVARSALLGASIDYSQIVPRGAAGESAARAAWARASAWLAAAPMVLAARTEIAGGEVNVGEARAQARAALLVARVIDFDVDAEAAYAWHRLASVAGFVGGATDDVTPRELGELASSMGIDVRDARSLIDTAKIDRLRHALASYRAPHLDDGSARRVASARLLPARDAADAELLQALVAPRVAGRTWPSALDVAAWLGSDDARALLQQREPDAPPAYDATMRRLRERRLPDEERHGSVYASSLDAIAAYLAPSTADAIQPGSGSPAWRRRKIEAALAAWTTLRRDALAFARFPLASSTKSDPEALAAIDLPAFVEPHPEAIAKLVSLVRQTSRGLRAIAAVGGDPSASRLLDEVEQLLVTALAIAQREADDAPLEGELRLALAAFPGRLRAIEKALAPSFADEASLAVDVHTDLGAQRAMVEACGDLDELVAPMREPRSGRLVLAVGVASSHYELTIASRDRPTDATWRLRLHGPAPPARDPLVDAYLVALEPLAAQ